ncbi:DUF2953 family protein [Tumebacillus sp. BK434]|uniref:DUF2953 domain-containing protein n=1 Tax=Tumebacillus sp. BK434 TaxID=2512169 RepID=UPI0010439906|nr:DUF2953 domain-containing protein [Tumebacillus sp. BK434]TCP59523.1 DUF2953 family protein [Tumebacillus sp. BK434]
MKWLWGLLLAFAIVLAALFIALSKWFAWYWILLLALVFFFLLTMVLPVTVEVRYKREGRDDRLHLGVRALFGLVKAGFEVPTIALMERSGKVGVKAEPGKGMPKQKRGWITITVEKVQRALRKINEIRKRIGKYKRAIRQTTKAFHIESFKWRTVFGTGDAAQTGYTTGLVWALKGIFAGMLHQYFTVSTRLLYDVKPHFQASGFRTELTCIIRFWPGKAILAGLKLVFLWLREGAKWRNIRSKA